MCICWYKWLRQLVFSRLLHDAVLTADIHVLYACTVELDEMIVLFDLFHEPVGCADWIHNVDDRIYRKVPRSKC
jgi:hypothetical protein